MGRWRTEYTIAALLAGSFWLAVIFANWLFYKGIMDYVNLYDMLKQRGERLQGSDSGIARVTVFVRFLQFWLLAAFAGSRNRSVYGRLGLVAAGFLLGFTIPLFTWCCGFAGLLCFLIAMFPQGVFYSLLYGFLLMCCFHQEQARKLQFLGIVLLLLCCGIVSELKLNPYLLYLIL